MAGKRRTKPLPPSRVIKQLTACNPSIQNIQRIIDGLQNYLDNIKLIQIQEIDKQIEELNKRKELLSNSSQNERPSQNQD